MSKSNQEKSRSLQPWGVALPMVHIVVYAMFGFLIMTLSSEVMKMTGNEDLLAIIEVLHVLDPIFLFLIFIAVDRLLYVVEDEHYAVPYSRAGSALALAGLTYVEYTKWTPGETEVNAVVQISYKAFIVTFLLIGVGKLIEIKKSRILEVSPYVGE